MTLNLSVDEVLTTTRSVRKRLDFDKPVPRDVLMECLELALQAPTGSNSQGWQWVFVEDAAKKKAIADVYLANARATSAGRRPSTPTATPAASGWGGSAIRRPISPNTCTGRRCC
ncbi:oxidoreductase [Mycobacterium tuberculosis variant bovis BCG]|nr:oxidoreductase [Mycobacterium tuberculosis variant bovis BCG]